MKTPEQIEDETIRRCIESIQHLDTTRGIVYTIDYILNHIERQYKSTPKKTCANCAIGVSRCYKTIQCARGKYSEWQPIQE